MVNNVQYSIKKHGSVKIVDCRSSIFLTMLKIYTTEKLKYHVKHSLPIYEFIYLIITIICLIYLFTSSILSMAHE